MSEVSGILEKKSNKNNKISPRVAAISGTQDTAGRTQLEVRRAKSEVRKRGGVRKAGHRTQLEVRRAKSEVRKRGGVRKAGHRTQNTEYRRQGGAG